MISESKLEANRANARKSTGPRTDRGKQRSSQNAVKHGLTAKTDVIPGDPYRSYKSYRRNLLAELSPQSFLERELADRIIGDLWRLKRIPKLESAIMREMRDKEPHVPPALAELAIALANKHRNFTTSSDESPESVAPVAHVLRHMGERSEQEAIPHTPVSTGWLDYSEQFARFSRYESSLERSLFRCLKEYRNVKSSPGGMDKLVVHARTLSCVALAKQDASKRASTKPSVPSPNEQSKSHCVAVSSPIPAPKLQSRHERANPPNSRSHKQLSSSRLLKSLASFCKIAHRASSLAPRRVSATIVRHNHMQGVRQ